VEDDHSKLVVTKYENYLENSRLGDSIKEFQNSLMEKPVVPLRMIEEKKPVEEAEVSLGKRDAEKLAEVAEEPVREVPETHMEIAEKCNKAWLEEEVCSWQSLKKKVKSEADSENKKTDTIYEDGKSEDDIISILSESALSYLSQHKPRSSVDSVDKSKSPKQEGYGQEYSPRRFELRDSHLGKKGRHKLQS
jgi:hypothetical protein